MAVPKRKHSRSRQATRRANWKATPTALVDCSHCGSRTRPHTVCMNCGYYRGKQILMVKD